jgi:hypothetical protein
MDITCRKCGEPWEVAYLRHDVAWYTCRHGQTVERSSSGWRHRTSSWRDVASDCDDPTPRLQIDPADNGQVPAEVAKVGEQGWYQFVAGGLGCPSCHGRPERQREIELTLAELDELDVATEGEFGHLLFP